MKKIIIVVVIIACAHFSFAQSLKHFADSIRKAYKIPELAYAIVSSDQVNELEVLGYKKSGSNRPAERSDLFRIGSNTKAITGLIAATLVKQGKLSWNTKFFDLFPEMRSKSRKEYWDVTLLNLLSLRTRLFAYTYTFSKPVKGQFTGNEEQQRYQFAEWFFRHDPVKRQDVINFSNLGYVAAGLMMEKASGKTYKEMVKELGDQLHIDFRYGRPNNIDTTQPWGHGADMRPEPPGDDYKLNWLLPAGNICVSLPDYAKFIQLQLQGLAGKSGMLTAQEFEFLHFGLPIFSVGWFWNEDENKRMFSFNNGNPGTFLTSVYVYKGVDKAFILFSNAQTDAAEEGMEILNNEMKRRYLK